MRFTPLPLSQTVTLSWTPYPLEHDVLYGRPLGDEMNSLRLISILYCQLLLFIILIKFLHAERFVMH